MDIYATMAAALYAELGRWYKVAAACNGKRLDHDGAYYCKIAAGKIKTPHLAARNGIHRAALAHNLTTVKHISRPDSPLGVSISRPLGPRINQWRISHSMAWDQWHEKAHELMRREYDEGSK